MSYAKIEAFYNLFLEKEKSFLFNLNYNILLIWLNKFIKIHFINHHHPSSVIWMYLRMWISCEDCECIGEKKWKSTFIAARFVVIWSEGFPAFSYTSSAHAFVSRVEVDIFAILWLHIQDVDKAMDCLRWTQFETTHSKGNVVCEAECYTPVTFLNVLQTRALQHARRAQLIHHLQIQYTSIIENYLLQRSYYPNR